MLNGIKLIMFDLDGTLVETGVEIANAINDTLSQLGLDPVSQKKVNGWIGRGTLELLVQALACASKATLRATRNRADLAEIKARFEQNYARHCGTVSTVYPGVLDVLDQLRERGVTRAVITNKDMRFTNVILDAHRLSERIEFVLAGDCVSAKKPDPIGILDCMKFFKVGPEQSLFIGDSSIDAAAARSAGVPVWLLTYGYNMNDPVGVCVPDRIIDNIAVLLE